jgi:hypothetical protein
MLLFPHEGCTFASEIDEWAGDREVILDPNMHVAHDAKEGTDIRKVLGIGPIADLGYF